jgi:cysteine-rich repeat protein
MAAARGTGHTVSPRGAAVVLRALLVAWLACAPASAEVLFQEDFEGSVDEIRASFGNGSTGPELRTSADRPPGSPGVQSLVLRGGQDATPSLYHRLAQDELRLYARYFVKYGSGAGFHHAGLYVGGYAPASDWPLGDAGLRGVRPNGDELVVVGFEPRSGPDRLDFYMNWIDMPGPAYQGSYYGRNVLRTEDVPVAPGAWRCVEVMVQLNGDPRAHDGELALWVDGEPVQHFRPGSPLGAWDEAGNWVTSASGEPFEGFRWRASTDLGLNWVRVLNYDSPDDVLVDDLVVSRERIGCGPTGGGGGGGGGGGPDPLCGNGALDAGEACDDGNGADADGCSARCTVDHGEQTPAQRRCIEGVNRGLAQLARARARANERCLARADGSADLEACLQEDRDGRLGRAAARAAGLAERSCRDEALPELALGPDPLAGAGAAQEPAGELARDLLGRPPVAAPLDEPRARRCQRGLLGRAHAVSGASSDAARAALTAKLAGRRTAAAVNDDELARFLEASLAGSPRLARAAASLRARAARACAGESDLAALFPGCGSAEADALGACAERAARCRACELLEAVNERLDLDCDRLDDGGANASCGPAS